MYHFLPFFQYFNGVKEIDMVAQLTFSALCSMANNFSVFLMSVLSESI